jgi:hypothetical protein
MLKIFDNRQELDTYIEETQGQKPEKIFDVWPE